MINLSDFQPLSIAQIKSVHQQPGFYRRYSVIKSMPFCLKSHDTNYVAWQRQFLYTQKYNYRTKIFTSAFKFCSKYSHINL